MEKMPVADQPSVEMARAYILDTLRNNPAGASTRFSLAEGLHDRYGGGDRDAARALVGRALAALQESCEVVVLRPESWDLSGDERVRLAT